MNEFYTARNEQIEDSLLSCLVREVYGDNGNDCFMSVSLPIEPYCLKPNLGKACCQPSVATAKFDGDWAMIFINDALQLLEKGSWRPY